MCITATAKKQKATQVNFTKMFKQEVYTIFNFGGIEQLIITLEQLYKDVFVYIEPSTQSDEDNYDYNMLDYDARYSINKIYEVLMYILKMALKHDFEHLESDVILIDETDTDNIVSMFKNMMYCKDKCNKLIDKMIITSILYKPMMLRVEVQYGAIGFYYWCEQLKDIFNGYLGKIGE